MIVDPDFPDHWKTRMLVDLLDDKSAPLYVVRLWAHCQNRKTDTFDNLPDAALKALCRFPGHANKLVSSLVTSGFVRRSGDSLEVLNWKQYNSQLFANWENGKKGGRPRKEPPPKTHGYPMANPSETDKRRVDGSRVDKSKVSDTDVSSCPPSGEGGPPPPPPPKKKADPVPYSRIFDLYRECCPSLKQMHVADSKRRAGAKRLWGRVKGHKDKERGFRSVRIYFEACQKSSFLRGEKPSKNHPNWKASFEFLTRDDVITKVMEGQYSQ